MCCLFGMIDCGHSFTGKQKARIIHALAASAEVRGTDASGIAYNSGGKLHVCKQPVPGHQLPLRIPNDAAVIMGHARMTTQGDGKRNYNNHPFLGKAGQSTFALAHNGVLHNDRMLRRFLKLPGTKIETDSYVAVQLIEKKRVLNLDSLRYMAEKVEGSFSFTVLDERDNLYFIKGDSPIYLCYYPKQRLYLYASTEAILLDALLHVSYPLGEMEQVIIDSGEILAVASDGEWQKTEFQFDDPFVFGWLNRWGWGRGRYCSSAQNDYTRDLKTVAGGFGVSPDQIDQLLNKGFTHEEIEDYLYCGEV